jgi:hypothetical protein
MPESGSSGSPLLNLNHKLIGLLHGLPGGFIFDYAYGKFSWAWENYCSPSPNKRLKDWLDSIGTGQTVLNGRGCQNTIKLWRSAPMPVYHAVQNIISKQIIKNGKIIPIRDSIEKIFKVSYEKEVKSNKED